MRASRSAAGRSPLAASRFNRKIMTWHPAPLRSNRSSDMLPFRPSIFRSFWMGGFESACHVNRAGVRLDMLCATQHDRFVAVDYALLPTMRVSTARDTLRWHRIEAVRGVYDFASV